MCIIFVKCTISQIMTEIWRNILEMRCFDPINSTFRSFLVHFEWSTHLKQHNFIKSKEAPKTFQDRTSICSTHWMLTSVPCVLRPQYVHNLLRKSCNSTNSISKGFDRLRNYFSNFGGDVRSASTWNEFTHTHSLSAT